MDTILGIESGAAPISPDLQGYSAKLQQVQIRDSLEEGIGLPATTGALDLIAPTAFGAVKFGERDVTALPVHKRNVGVRLALACRLPVPAEHGERLHRTRSSAASMRPAAV